MDRPKATHGCSTTRTEYQVETGDIRVVRELESSGKQDSNETSSRQNQLDKLQPNKDFKYLTSKHNRGQSLYLAQDVCLKDRDERWVKLLNRAGACGSGQQTGHDPKKTIGLQEYQDQQQNQGKATSAATTSSKLQEEEDWDKDLSLP